MILKLQLPEKLMFLVNRKARYKIARGGRGSAKSWSFARALLALGASRRLRILCAREVQRSIADSVHKLLKDQIELLGLHDQYEVLQTEIRGANGTEFAFAGLSSLTVSSIKSFEGFDFCWVEEGQTVSDGSWKILIPTIRKDDSEIWVSYNPDLETDPTHQRFTINPPTDTINVLMNWRDNPWFNNVLNKERLDCKANYPDDYDNIWEGKCRPAVEGAIYYKEIQKAEAEGRICNIPYDPLLRVHIVLDLGWEDSLGSALVQKNLSEIRVLEYLEASHTSLPILSAELKKRQYNWGRVWPPHDAYAGQLNAEGKSSYAILKKLGWDVVPRNEITEVSVEEGIRQARLVFPRIYFDAKKTAAIKSPQEGFADGFNWTDLNHRLIECLKRYRRRVTEKTGAVGSPLRDPHAHGADVLRYIAINADSMINADQRPTIHHPEAVYQPLDAYIGM